MNISRSISSRMRTTVIVLCLGLPSAALAQEPPPEYVSTSLSATVTMIEGRGGNVAVSFGDDGVFVIDDQFADISSALVEEVGRITGQPIRFLVNTHYHGDHVGGNAAFAEKGAVIIAHDNVYQRMSTEQFSSFMNSTTEPWPTGALPVVSFSERMSLRMNGEIAAIHHVANAHTDGDSIVHFPVSNVIHMGDTFFNGFYPYIDLDGGGSIKGFIAALEVGIGLADANTKIIPGHGPVTGVAELQRYRDTVVKVRDKVQALIDQGKTLEQAIEAKPTAEWDEAMGKGFIGPAQLVTFIYNSLTGVNQFTRIEANTAESH